MLASALSVFIFVLQRYVHIAIVCCKTKQDALKYLCVYGIQLQEERNKTIMTPLDIWEENLLVVWGICFIYK